MHKIPITAAFSAERSSDLNFVAAGVLEPPAPARVRCTPTAHRGSDCLCAGSFFRGGVTVPSGPSIPGCHYRPCRGRELVCRLSGCQHRPWRACDGLSGPLGISSKPCMRAWGSMHPNGVPDVPAAVLWPLCGLPALCGSTVLSCSNPSFSLCSGHSNIYIYAPSIAGRSYF